ncbi:MAG: type III pantothenate kinase [Pirellulales bacterium]|nr:type III pantothenate kinase [Pirellulales bacterium]
MSNHLFVAADVGNARIKLGLFEGEGKGDSPHLPERPGGCSAQMGTVPFFLPEPLRTLPLQERGNFQFDRIVPWLADIAQESFCWRIASVNRPAATLLIDWLRDHRPADRVTLLATDDLPLEVRLPRPDMVGIDRLVDAVAVNRLRHSGQPAVIVDVGTAITVDLVSAEGVFLGGAIMPGIEMSARALHQFTDLLPPVDTSDLESPPPPVGADTVSAIQSGLYWGAVGAIRELVERQCEAASGASLGGNQTSWGGSSTATPTHSTATPTQVFLTGGASAAVADLLGPAAHHIPNLTLTGIALAVKPSATGPR